MSPLLITKSLEDYFKDEIRSRSEEIASSCGEDLNPPTRSSAFDCHVNRRQLACMDELLRKERTKYGEKQKGFQKRWTAASKILEEIDETIVHVNDPYLDGVLEKAKAINKAIHQEALHTDKKKGIKRLSKEKEFIEEIKTKTLERLEKFKVVETYLASVVTASHGEFNSIRELLERATLLFHTKEELTARNDQLRERIVRRERELKNYSLLKRNSNIVLSSFISDLQDDLRDAKEVCRKLETDVAQLKTTAATKTTKLGRLRIGTYNIYNQICTKLGRPMTISITDIVNQLDYILSSLVEINRLRHAVTNIIEKANQLENRDNPQLQRKKLRRWKTSLLIAKQARQREMNRNRKLFQIKDRTDSPHLGSIALMVNQLIKEKNSEVQPKGE